MNNLQTELIYMILWKSKYDDICSFCQTCKSALLIYHDTYFWQKKAELINIPREVFYKTDLIPARRYIQLATFYENDISIHAKDHVSIDCFGFSSIVNKRIDLLNYSIKKGFQDFDKALLIAGGTRSKEILDLLLKYKKNYNHASFGLIRFNEEKLFDYIYSLAPPDYRWHWNLLGVNAVKGNHKDLLIKIMRLAKDFCWDFQRLSETAILNKHFELFKYIYSLANYEWDYQNLARLALYVGNLQLFEYIYSLANNNTWDWQELAYYALSYSKEIFYYIYSLFNSIKKEDKWDWNIFINCGINSIEDLDYFNSLIPNWNWNWALICEKAIQIWNLELFNYAIEKSNIDEINWQKIGEIIANKDDLELFKHIHSLAKNYDWNYHKIFRNSLRNEEKIIEYLIRFDEIKWDQTKIVKYVLKYKGYEDFKFFINKNPPVDFIWESFIKVSITLDSKFLLDKILHLIPNNYELNYNVIASYAIIKNNIYLFEYIYSLAPDYKWNWQYLCDCAVLNKYNSELYYELKKFIPADFVWDKSLLLQSPEISENIKLKNFIMSFT
ncbi:MAG: hypothetical protein QW303_01125 [Nitrososphaerota archaeon]